MKRSELVENLIKEGMSEKTLVNFTDKQLSNLHERMVISADKLKSDPKLQAIANDPNTEVEVKEDLKGNQKKLDKNHNGKIDGQDFKILKGQKKEISEDKECKSCGCTKSECKCKKVTKGHNNIPEFMDSKKLKKEGVETKKWVESLAEEKFFHILTSKNEIMEMIQTKLNDQKSQEKTELPDFLKWASLKSVKGKKEVAEGGTTTKPAPTKPKVAPGTKPKHPLSPGKFPKQIPKALAEKK